MHYHSPEELQEQARQLIAEYVTKVDDLKTKDRMKIPPQEMPAQNPEERIHNLDEVAIGYTFEQARIEALRCLQCVKKNCVDDCPVKIDIPRFINHLVHGDLEQAASVIKEASLLPAICGRVCPQETQCQSNCTVGKALKDVDKSVAIGRLERFVADWERTTGKISIPEIKQSTSKKVAVVGSGPAGLVVAADCRREGHHVTVFEAFHKLGGVLRYGIPEFRLPNDIIDKEIQTLEAMGVEFKTNFVVGKTRKLKDLMEKDEYDAVFIGVGAGLPIFMGIEGENLIGVFSANEYLTRANLMRAFDKEHADTPIYPSKKVAVLGGGNVAMDAARMAKRLGAENVYVVYRRTEKEMPARKEEVAHAKEEGIEFLFLQNAKRIIGDEEGKVKQIECLRYELGEPDSSGRRRPIEIKGSEFLIDVDTVIVAIGNGSNPLLTQSTPGLELNKWGNIIVDENQKTSLDKVYAGGDIVLGAATVILAMGEGRRAAAAINKMLAEEIEKEKALVN
ncbi:NADPH-dependent glutamate synthase [Stygiobacter electus]|uniref:NADPH-dependent glutamate synthase n=1 Tax=Stygiobacter electus TaxID=3032292 RepID=A0AAE3TEN2_9BACT|nr:NADPH-dependent glutamate synthase [Stygiobacter electus]MDF1612453.1 NADPH-dependent glutamate synthase [Stygiobacter electus]